MGAFERKAKEAEEEISKEVGHKIMNWECMLVCIPFIIQVWSSDNELRSGYWMLNWYNFWFWTSLKMKVLAQISGTMYPFASSRLPYKELFLNLGDFLPSRSSPTTDAILGMQGKSAGSASVSDSMACSEGNVAKDLGWPNPTNSLCPFQARAREPRIVWNTGGEWPWVPFVPGFDYMLGRYQSAYWGVHACI